jgi:hypothetical protein
MWWPNGYGDATLYLVTVSYDDTSGDFEQKSFHIGFRSVDLVQDKVSSGELILVLARRNLYVLFRLLSFWSDLLE